MRYILAHKGKYEVKQRVGQYLNLEKKLKLHEANTYNIFKQNCENSKARLVDLLNELNQNNKSVVGYAATSKCTTVLNYCNITSKQIQYISDTTPIKIGKFSPGMHIPIQAHTSFSKKYPDYAVLFAWNHRDEILAKEQNFLNAGGNWITFVPKLSVFNKEANNV